MDPEVSLSFYYSSPRPVISSTSASATSGSVWFTLEYLMPWQNLELEDANSDYCLVNVISKAYLNIHVFTCIYIYVKCVYTCVYVYVYALWVSLYMLYRYNTFWVYVLLCMCVCVCICRHICVLYVLCIYVCIHILYIETLYTYTIYYTHIYIKSKEVAAQSNEG